MAVQPANDSDSVLIMHFKDFTVNLLLAVGVVALDFQIEIILKMLVKSQSDVLYIIISPVFQTRCRNEDILRLNLIKQFQI